MKALTRFFLYFALLIIAGLGIFLAAWDMPAPASTHEEVIPNGRFK